jgi:tetratricopeptide (TPR) repeat protein
MSAEAPPSTAAEPWEVLPTQHLIHRAKAAMAGGAPLAALAELDEVAHREPRYADVHNLRGLCLIRLERHADAIRAFDAALAVNDGYVDAHLNRVASLRALGRDAEADVAAARAKVVMQQQQHERYPPQMAAELANLHAQVGDAYAAGGFLLEAADQYRRACEIRPGFVDIRHRLATTLMELGIMEGAIRELTSALELRPSYTEARATLGLALYRTGDVVAARLHWEQCPDLSRDPEVQEFLRQATAAAPASSPGGREFDAA